MSPATKATCPGRAPPRDRPSVVGMKRSTAFEGVKARYDRGPVQRYGANASEVAAVFHAGEVPFAAEQPGGLCIAVRPGAHFDLIHISRHWPPLGKNSASV